MRPIGFSSVFPSLACAGSNESREHERASELLLSSFLHCTVLQSGAFFRGSFAFGDGIS